MTRFVVAAGTGATLLDAPACHGALLAAAPGGGGIDADAAFAILGPAGRPQGPPFARIAGWRSGCATPPFARMAQRIVASSDEGSGMMQRILADSGDERRADLPRRGRPDAYYNERCTFCARCKATVTSQFAKRGTRCHGCRRWFHDACMLPSGAASAEGADEAGAAAAAEAAAADGEGPSASSAAAAAAGSLFFHSGECRGVFGRLSEVAEAGEHPLPIPPKRGFLPWQQLEQEQEVWRLLDLSDVQHAFSHAQRLGLLHKQRARAQQRLSAQQQQQPQQRQGQAEEAAAAPPASAVHSRLDDFLVAAELMGEALGEAPRDLLEDTFAVVSRTERGGLPTCAATFNLHGDHARLQGIATPQGLQRQGHATRLVQQLEKELLDAGLQHLVVILEPQAARDGRPDSAAVERWLTRRLGYKHASSEQRMLWRRELPDYHKNLTAGCTLLVKPLVRPRSRGWPW